MIVKKLKIDDKEYDLHYPIYESVLLRDGTSLTAELYPGGELQNVRCNGRFISIVEYKRRRGFKSSATARVSPAPRSSRPGGAPFHAKVPWDPR